MSTSMRHTMHEHYMNIWNGVCCARTKANARNVPATNEPAEGYECIYELGR